MEWMEFLKVHLVLLFVIFKLLNNLPLITVLLGHAYRASPVRKA